MKVDLTKTVRDAMKDSGLTPYAIARDSGVDYSQITRFLHGQRGLTLDSASKICELLGLELRPIRRKGGK